jgi:hypothetical protein
LNLQNASTHQRSAGHVQTSSLAQVRRSTESLDKSLRCNKHGKLQKLQARDFCAHVKDYVNGLRTALKFLSILHLWGC